MCLYYAQTLFFVNSVDGCFRLKLFLEQFSIPSAVLNSELPYNSRAHIIEQFNRGVFDYLIATDASIDEDDAAADGDKDGVAEAGADGAVEDMDIDDEHEAKKAAANKTSKEQRVRKRKADGDLAVEYGVSRGVDFQVPTRCTHPCDCSWLTAVVVCFAACANGGKFRLSHIHQELRASGWSYGTWWCRGLCFIVGASWRAGPFTRTADPAGRRVRVLSAPLCHRCSNMRALTCCP
mgnify:CR=1 FL=1